MTITVLRKDVYFACIKILSSLKSTSKIAILNVVSNISLMAFYCFLLKKIKSLLQGKWIGNYDFLWYILHLSINKYIFYIRSHTLCICCLRYKKKTLKRYQIEKFIFEEIKSFTDQIYFMIRITYYDWAKCFYQIWKAIIILYFT